MTKLDTVLTHRTASWFGVLVVDILLVIAKRRTITKWIQSAGLSEHFQQIFYHLTNIGLRWMGFPRSKLALNKVIVMFLIIQIELTFFLNPVIYFRLVKQIFHWFGYS
jgi:hypothetical protein